MKNEPQVILNEKFGFSHFRPLQEEIIHHLLHTGDALVLMPTGGGKSLCYQVPGLCLEGLTLVVSPLISLMINQVEALKNKGVSAAYLNSNLSLSEKRELAAQIQRGEIEILYTSPESLASEKLIDFLNRVGVTFLAIDEAHCVSQWGHEFRKDYRNLGEVRRLLGSPRCVALTATADPLVRQDILKELGIAKDHIYCSGFDRPNLVYRAQKREANGYSQLREFLRGKEEQTGIIYCSTRKKTEEVADQIREWELNVFPYHAGMPDDERNDVQRKFEQDPNIIIVATVAFGMGIDRPDVRFVVHMNLSKTIESYYQETGRAGRDGLTSETLMLYGAQEFELYRRFIRESEADDNYKKTATGKLFSMQKFANSMKCRRRQLREYFGETVKKNCGTCDNCTDDTPLKDWTTEAFAFLTTVKETGQRFGKVHIIDVLRGAQNQRIRDFGHDRLTMYGHGKDLSVKDWKLFSDGLIAEDFLSRCEETDGLKLLPLGQQLLKRKVTFEQRYSKDDLKQSTKKKKTKKTKISTPASRETGNDDQQLFEWLRHKRNELAADLKYPPFYITSNKTLEEISAQRPTTEEELLSIKGIGPRKVEEYGSALLHAVKSYQSNPAQCQQLVEKLQ